MSKSIFDSDEELYASYFFEELRAKGFIKEIIYQPSPFVLAEDQSFEWDKPKPTKKEPDRIERKTTVFLKGAEYTPDTRIVWDEKAYLLLYTLSNPLSNKCNLFIAHPIFNKETELWEHVSYIEVKPLFDDNNMTREVVIKHKWVYKDYGIYVNLFIRDKIMPKLFTPERYVLTQVYQKKYTNKKKNITYQAGESKIRWKVRTLEEYLTTVG